MKIDAYFRSLFPEDRAREIFIHILIARVDPDDLLIRTFAGSREYHVRKFGTDRAGIDSYDGRILNADKEWGNDRILARRGLMLEDGLYATPLGSPEHLIEILDADNRRPINLPKGRDLTEHIISAIRRGANVRYSGRCGVSLYNADALEKVNNDFYVFKNPEDKISALEGIIVETIPRTYIRW